MGASSSSPSVARTAPPQCSHFIHLVTHALRILGEHTKQLGTHYAHTDRRLEFLRIFRSAAMILLDRIGAVERDKMISRYELSINELAILLEEVLDDGLIRMVDPKVRAASFTTAAPRTHMPLVRTSNHPQY